MATSIDCYNPLTRTMVFVDRIREIFYVMAESLSSMLSLHKGEVNLREEEQSTRFLEFPIKSKQEIIWI